MLALRRLAARSSMNSARAPAIVLYQGAKGPKQSLIADLLPEGSASSEPAERFRIPVPRHRSHPQKARWRSIIRPEIEYLVAGCTKDVGGIPDYQMAAWLMAVVLRGMTREETAAVAHAMLHSGEVLDLTSCPQKSGQALHRRRRRQDLAAARPMVAAGGLYVPMISGRGWATPAVHSTNSNPFQDFASLSPCPSSIAF